MKDSIFLLSLSKNEAKLVEAGEYKQKFNESYDVLKKQNHLALVDKNLLCSILDCVKIMKEKK